MMTFILIVESNSLSKHDITSKYECIISSNKYHYEFLYASGPKGHVFAINYMAISNMNELKWELVQYTNTQDKYYIRSKQNGQYLCSDHQQLAFIRSILNDQDKINRNKMDDRCVWRLERTDSDWQYNSYFIKNIHFDENLFAGNMKLNKTMRYVFMSDKNQSSDRFKWFIECQ